MVHLRNSEELWLVDAEDAAACAQPSRRHHMHHACMDDAIQGSMTAGSHMARYKETHVVESCRHMTRHESFVIGSTNWRADFRKKQ
jgi:hypothetical protein